MALPNGIQSTQELLDAQSHIYNHIFSYINSMSLKCALQLRIPDVIHDHNKPITLSELADALSINRAKTACLGRLMRILVHSNFFTTTEEGYWLTPVSRLLCRNDLAKFVLSTLDPVSTDSEHHMAEWFKDDEPTPFATAHGGRTMWEVIAEDPRIIQVFNDCQSSDTGLLMSVIVKDGANIFRELESMVDIGGGTGTMARAIADAFPSLKCTVLDLPHVVQGLQGTHNLKFVQGDMFKAIPSAQAVSLKNILHDWSDVECIQILKKCKEAIPRKGKGGKVIIIDIVVGHQKDNFKAMETQLLIDIKMMILVTGKERTEKEWAKLFYGAGFTSYNIIPVLGLRSVIEVFP